MTGRTGTALKACRRTRLSAALSAQRPSAPAAPAPPIPPEVDPALDTVVERKAAHAVLQLAAAVAQQRPALAQQPAREQPASRELSQLNRVRLRTATSAVQLTGKTSTTSTITKQPSPSLLGERLGLPSTLFYTPYSKMASVRAGACRVGRRAETERYRATNRGEVRPCTLRTPYRTYTALGPRRSPRHVFCLGAQRVQDQGHARRRSE